MNNLFQKIVVFIAVVIGAGCLSSCAGNGKNIINNIMQSSSDTFIQFRQSDGYTGRFFETSLGCYLLNDKFVYYAESGSTNYIKLCGKPNCSHDSFDCNAYVNSITITYGGGYIYYISTDSEKNGVFLYRMDADGTNHKEIKKIKEIGGFYGYFHEEYLYYINGTAGNTLNEDTGFYRVALFDDSASEKIADTAKIGTVNLFRLYKDYIYIISSLQGNCILSRYCISDGTWIIILENWDEYGIGYYEEDKVYAYKSGEGLFEYDFSTKILSCVAEVKLEGNYAAFYDDNYIYMIQYFDSKTSEINPMFYIYSRDYNLINQIKLDIPISDCRVVPYFADTDQYILISSNIMIEPPDYYLKKSEIGSGNMQIYKME